MKKALGILFLAVLMAACAGKTEKEKLEELKTEVIAIHDEAMLQMDDIFKMRSKAEKALESLDDQEEKQKLQSLIKELDEADEAMMGWMRGFKMYESDLGDISSEEIWAYYENEKVKIAAVKEQMLEAISNAEKSLS